MNRDLIKNTFDIIYSELKIQYVSDEEPTDTVYSDRLHQWDYKKYNELCKKHFENGGQSFYNRLPDQIEKFLSEYLGKEITLCRIEKTENVSNGNPLWRFDYKEK